MGVAIPDEFRPDMAMVGEWQVTSQKIVDEGEEKKPDALAMGVRKRVLGDEEEVALEAKRRKWGSTYKTHPGEEDDTLDLDALLNNATRKGKEVKREDEPKLKIEINGNMESKVEEGFNGATSLPTAGETQEEENIKNEPSDDKVALDTALPTDDTTSQAEASMLPGVVFKKRKAKNIRQK